MQVPEDNLMYKLCNEVANFFIRQADELDLEDIEELAEDLCYDVKPEKRKKAVKEKEKELASYKHIFRVTVDNTPECASEAVVGDPMIFSEETLKQIGFILLDDTREHW